MDESDINLKFKNYLKPYLHLLLSSVSLDIHYHKAEGDYLYYYDDGKEVKILDMLGGYGASLFGHNHPELIKIAIESYQEKIPFNTQASVRKDASLCAEQLSKIVGAYTQQEYVVTLGNSGAEAVEAALKHANFALVNKIKNLKKTISTSITSFQNDLTNIAEKEKSELFNQIASRIDSKKVVNSFQEIIDFILEFNDNTFNIPSTAFAFEKSFHGKTSGALQVTYKKEFRDVLSHTQYKTVFLKLGDIQQLNEKIQENTLYYYEFVFSSEQKISLEKRAFINISSCIIEPVQGEGGIHIVPRDYAQYLSDVMRRIERPLIIDEIQSGLGRTGSFLASQQIGLSGQYYIFSKSLGGGLAKISALLVESNHYQEQFSYVHSSTFADDDFSSRIALAALRLITQHDHVLIKKCEAAGDQLLGELYKLREKYGKVISDIRGKGLMIGVEFDITQSGSPLINLLSEQKLLGYLISSYLFHHFHIRVAPTLSSNLTIRIEPSAYISSDNIDYFIQAMATLCDALDHANIMSLISHLVGPIDTDKDERKLIEEVQKNSVVTQKSLRPSPAHLNKVTFIGHLLSVTDITHWDHGLDKLNEANCENMIDRFSGVIAPFNLGNYRVYSDAMDSAVDVEIIVLFNTAQQMMQAFRNNQAQSIIDKLNYAVSLSRDNQSKIVGFGGYTSIVSNNCRDISLSDLCLTSGNSLTAGAAVEVTMSLVEKYELSQSTLGIVGAAGNIGKAMAFMLSKHFKKIILFGRQASFQRLRNVAYMLNAYSGNSIEIELSSDLYDLKKCQVILTASNAPQAIIHADHLHDKNRVVICDVAIPHDVDKNISRQKENVKIINGGAVYLPGNQVIDIPTNQERDSTIYACLAETILLGFEKVQGHHYYGALDPQRISQLIKLAKMHGFKFV